jgi:hypothetical protein
MIGSRTAERLRLLQAAGAYLNFLGTLLPLALGGGHGHEAAEDVGWPAPAFAYWVCSGRGVLGPAQVPPAHERQQCTTIRASIVVHSTFLEEDRMSLHLIALLRAFVRELWLLWRRRHHRDRAIGLPSASMCLCATACNCG